MEPAAATTTSAESVQPSFVDRLQASLRRQGQAYLDASVPYLMLRWVVFSFVLMAYFYRVYVLEGFYIVTYGLGIFFLNQFIHFLSPLEEFDESSTGPDREPLLPVNTADEFKPFVRRLPEFPFWYTSIRAVLLAFGMTFFSFFDIPVFWPILLIYFIALFAFTMKERIKHMLKHKYVPFNVGKKTYGKGSGPVNLAATAGATPIGKSGD